LLGQREHSGCQYLHWYLAGIENRRVGLEIAGQESETSWKLVPHQRGADRKHP